METSHQLVNFMNRMVTIESFKYILVIGLLAICAGFTAKNVISYPTERTSLEMVTLR